MLILALTACGGTKPAEKPAAPAPKAEAPATPAAPAAPAKAANENVLYLTLNADASKNRIDNPLYNRGSLTSVVLFRSLLISDSTFTKYSPDLAKEWKVAPDGLTYEFVLGDVKWSDGKPVAPADVKFTFEMILKTPVKNANFNNAASKVKGAKDLIDKKATELAGIAIDGNKITISLEKPYADFEKLCAQIPILPKHALETADPLELAQNEYFKQPIANGPFKVTKFEEGNFILFEHNDKYEGAKPNIEKIQVNFLTDPIAAAQAGKIDYHSTNIPEQINEINKIGKFTQFDVEILFYRYFVVNYCDQNGKPVGQLANPKIREALMMAIDRKTIVDSFYKEIGAITNSGVQPASPSFDKGQKSFDYNPELAKKMLQEAGFDFNQTLRLRYYYKDQTSINMMEAIGSMLNAVGVKTDVMMFQNDGTTELWSLRNYELALKGLSAFSLSEWYGEYVNANYAKVLGEIDPAYRKLISDYELTVDPAAREGVLKQIQAKEQETLYKLPLFTMNQVVFVNTDKIQLPEGMKFGNPWYYYNVRISEWKIK